MEKLILVSAIVKCLISAILENCFYYKVLSKTPYLSNASEVFINFDNFLIIEKDISFFPLPVSLIQYRGAIGMFDNVFANNRCIRSRYSTVYKYNRMNLV